MHGGISGSCKYFRKLAPGFKITAWAPDSIAEAIEAYPKTCALPILHFQSERIIKNDSYCHINSQTDYNQKEFLGTYDVEQAASGRQWIRLALIPGIKRFPLIGISTDKSSKRTAVNTAYVQSVFSQAYTVTVFKPKRSVCMSVNG